MVHEVLVRSFLHTYTAMFSGYWCRPLDCQRSIHSNKADSVSVFTSSNINEYEIHGDKHTDDTKYILHMYRVSIWHLPLYIQEFLDALSMCGSIKRQMSTKN